MLPATLRCPCRSRPRALLLLLLPRETPASGALARPRPLTGADAAAGGTLPAARRRFHRTAIPGSEAAAAAPAAEENGAGAPGSRADAAPAERPPPTRPTKTQLLKDLARLKAELAAAQSAYEARSKRRAKAGAAPTFAPVEEQRLEELKAAVKAAKAALKAAKAAVKAAKAAPTDKPVPPAGDDGNELPEACPNATPQESGIAPLKYLKTWSWLVKHGLDERLAENAKQRGWPQPLTIQERIIPDVLKGYNVRAPNGTSEPFRFRRFQTLLADLFLDAFCVGRHPQVVASARTGEGKTAAFVLPVLHRLLEMKAAGEDPELSKREFLAPQAIVLAPTAELSRQIADEINKLAVGLPVRAAAIYQPGEPLGVQLRRARTADIIVGTAGRILSHVEGPMSPAERKRKLAATGKACADEGLRPLANEPGTDAFEGVGDDSVPDEQEGDGKRPNSAENVGPRPHQKSYMLLGDVRFLVLDECFGTVQAASTGFRTGPDQGEGKARRNVKCSAVRRSASTTLRRPRRGLGADDAGDRNVGDAFARGASQHFEFRSHAQSLRLEPCHERPTQQYVVYIAAPPSLFFLSRPSAGAYLI
ncbi:MAG: hypothetical protein BJ554DRAFT_850 [Olpidium bornovanus]|uniref:RNA helicase n=1 Tax=Olpidium bornovanus TaxID=278681 RepID=A0A8H7ZSW8_9FUNG|nr:MAG: hypothetical protein BJ554DRAFT_850 [Olpidium bornovanus]